MTARVAVVGGGITGLSAAHRILELSRERGAGVSVVVLEAGPRPGGVIRQDVIEGVLLEGGPDTLLLHKPAGRDLCARLGLESRLVPIDPARHRVQVLRAGRLVDVPAGFIMMAPTRLGPVVRSELFSLRGKLRLAMERFLPARPPRSGDESLASFVSRRFGREVLERVAEPLLASLFLADADRLSMRAALPRFLEMERRQGSVTRAIGAAKAARAGERQGTSAGGASGAAHVLGGFGCIVETLTRRLPAGSIRTGTPVAAIASAPLPPRWRIQLREAETLEADAVILACPAYASASILEPLAPALSAELGRLEYASCATVNLLYRRSDVGGSPRSAGFFFPRTEKRSLLAASVVSGRDPDRVPADRVLLRGFLGGSRQPGVMAQDDDAIAHLAHEELSGLLRIRRGPIVSRTNRFLRAMPQFEVGFTSRLGVIETHLETLAGVFLAGAHTGAVGVPDCVASAERAAFDAIGYLAKVGEGPSPRGSERSRPARRRTLPGCAR